MKLGHASFYLGPLPLQIFPGYILSPSHFVPLLQSNIFQSMLDIKTKVYLLFSTVSVFNFLLEFSCYFFCVCTYLCQALEESFVVVSDVFHFQHSRPDAYHATNLSPWWPYVRLLFHQKSYGILITHASVDIFHAIPPNRYRREERRRCRCCTTSLPDRTVFGIVPRTFVAAKEKVISGFCSGDTNETEDVITISMTATS